MINEENDMHNSKKPIKKDKTLPVLGAVFAVVLIGMIVALCVPKTAQFTPPPFEANAVQGTPENVPEELGFAQRYETGMAYIVSFCDNPMTEGDALVVYFASDERNEKYVKLRIFDTEGNILGESGLLRPGEYVRTVTLSAVPTAGAQIRIKVMGYEPEDYTSAGAVSGVLTVGGALS